MSFATVFLVVAVILFAIGAFSRWWVSPTPWYPSFVCAGLFFWALSSLWPQLTR
ncbi:MAG: hypothetical protein WA618_02000 [Terriglobales bacterium]